MAPPKGKRNRARCPRCDATVAVTLNGALYPHICGEETIVCKGCRQEKSKDEYYRDRTRPRGRVAQCKECYKETAAKVTRMKPWRREQEVRCNASKRGLGWSLTREEFMSFWQKPCFYCGDEIQTVGLDRIDNSEGYSKENVVPCCGTCNAMKSALTQEDFIERCGRIATRANAAIAINE